MVHKLEGEGSRRFVPITDVSLEGGRQLDRFSYQRSESIGKFIVIRQCVQ